MTNVPNRTEVNDEQWEKEEERVKFKSSNIKTASSRSHVLLSGSKRRDGRKENAINR